MRIATTNQHIFQSFVSDFVIVDNICPLLLVPPIDIGSGRILLQILSYFYTYFPPPLLPRSPSKTEDST